MRVIFFPAAFSFFLFFSVIAAFAEDSGTTARGAFTMLPITIFENTPEGLTEQDKTDLLLNGRTEFWEIAGETPDILVFASLPFHDRTIGVRVFHNEVDGSAEIAMGTIGDPVCALELWRVGTSGRIMPVDTPQEPTINDYFLKKRRPPRTVRHATQICLGNGGLVAVPIFWNKHGMIKATPDFDISYQWNGKEFARQIQRASGR